MTNSGKRRLDKNEIQDLSGGRKWLKWMLEYRFVMVVFAIALQTIIFTIFVSLVDVGEQGLAIVGSSTFILLLIVCALAVSKDRKSARIGLIWGGISIIATWLGILIPELGFLGFFYLTFFLYTTVVIIYTVTASKEININIIFGSIAGFFLIGVMGATVCSIIEILIPGSFHMSEDMGNLYTPFFYYAFITMTSLGYGDITPATELTRAISVYLVVIGQLYLAITVAILVGKYIARSYRTQDEKQQEIEDLKEEIRSLKNRHD